MKFPKVYCRFVAIVLLLSCCFSITCMLPVGASEESKITRKLQEVMNDTEQDAQISFVFIELSITDDDYNRALTDEGQSVSELNAIIDKFDDTSSYAEVKDVVVQKRHALCDYCYQRNESFISEYGIQSMTRYISSLNVIVGTYSPKDIRRIENDERVVCIGWDDPEGIIESEIADEYVHVRSNLVTNAGYTGNGIKIGVIEKARNITSITGSTYVSSVYISGEPSSDISGAEGAEHALRVVGVLRTVASKAHIYVTRVSDNGLVAATQIMNAAQTLANSYGVDVLNISLGQYTTENNYSSVATLLEGLVRNLDLTICCACGNEAVLDNRVSIFSAGDNVIGVGAVKWVGGTDQYDPMPDTYRYYEYGSAQEAVNKPDLCTSGYGISVTYAASQYSVPSANGTSFSTPIVSGIVAQLMQKNASLIGRQSLVKALLSAGAKHKGRTDYITTGNRCYSLYEGTGVVDAYCSYSVLNQSRYATQTISQSNQGSTYTKSITVTSSDAVIRVALSWLKRTNRSNFNLKIYKGSTLVAQSVHTSSDRVQNLRAVEFKPADYGYGTYTIKVVYQSINNSSESFSVAWY